MIRVEKIDEVYLRVTSEPDVEMELEEHFLLDVPGAKYSPKFKIGIWDGKLRLYSSHRKTLYVGLLSYLQYFAKTNDYEISIAKELQETTDITREETETFVTNLNCHSNGKPIIARDYQIESIYQALKRKRLIIESPTASGKSLNIYAIIRYLVNENKRILVLTPRANLVEQLFQDCIEYSSENGWDVEANCARHYSGMPKMFEKNVIFGTWQGIYKNPRNWFINQSFDCVILDECHTGSAQCLKGILEKLPTTPWRMGFSGTVATAKVNRLILDGLFGDCFTPVTTKKLMDDKQISQLKIKSIILDYNEEIKKKCVRLEYQKEMDFLISNQKRNKFIVNLAKATKNTTLLISNYVEKHCDVFYEYLINNPGDKKIFYMTGRTDIKTRENIRNAMKTEQNSILIASYGIFSTGINLPQISTIIFASPSKSSIRVLQSIGRGLRLAENKTHCTLFDISDNLCYRKYQNHTFRHANIRMKLYLEQSFETTVTKINLDNPQINQ